MYIDTSSLVAYYLPEPKSNIVQESIGNTNQIQISRLTEIEIISAINKKVRMKKVSKDKSDEAYQLFQDHQKSGLFNTLELSAAVFKSSKFILQTTMNPLRTLDAIHLGVVHEFGLDLFTFDKLLIKTAKEFNIAIVEY